MARKKKSAQKPDAVTLAQANRFNPSALAANRQGRLDSGQISRLALRLTSMLLSAIVALAFGIASFVLAALVLPKEALAENWVSLLGTVLLSLLGLVWLWEMINHLWRQTLPLLRDVVGGQVRMEEGAVSRDYDDNSYASLWHRLLTWVFRSFAEDHAQHIWWFSGVHYYVLNGQQFTVSQKGYAALTQESPWRLYYASHSKRLVNIEPAPGSTNV
jgi:hypothetical protein